MLLDAGFLRHDGNVVTKAIFNKLLKRLNKRAPSPPVWRLSIQTHKYLRIP